MVRYRMFWFSDHRFSANLWFANQRSVGNLLFEIGGQGKGFSQIKDMPNSYVANDGVEVGFGNKIPLWLFGFLY